MVGQCKKCFQPLGLPKWGSLGILILRVVAGVAFILHGWGKIQTPFGWMGPEAPVPGIFQALAALAEFGGGLAWILGLLTPLASLGMFFTMTVAVLTHAVMNGDPFVSTGGPSYELALVYWSVALLFMTMGPGKYSADAKIFGHR